MKGAKRWWLVIALLLSVGVNAGVLATLALHRDRGGHDHRERDHRPDGPRRERSFHASPDHLRRLADRLRLTGEERERFVAVQRRFFDAAGDAHRERLRLQGELRQELLAPDPDRERVGALVEETTRANLVLERAFVDLVLDSRAILDGEQEERYLAILSRLRHHLDDRNRWLRRPEPRPDRR